MEEKVIGLDFKTVTLGMQGDEFLSLIVIATPNRIAAFDLVHSDIILLESGVKEILESEKVVKVLFYYLVYLRIVAIRISWHVNKPWLFFNKKLIFQIMHEARRIASLLAHRYAVNLRRIFDTQVSDESQIFLLLFCCIFIFCRNATNCYTFKTN